MSEIRPITPGRIIAWAFAVIVGAVGLGVVAFVLALMWGLVQAVQRS